ncbi:hypothetical protein KJ616_00500 [Patescibacteria group bacterium]|nr:hypothetical protein [Patescibacteria group bacterium]
MPTEVATGQVAARAGQGVGRQGQERGVEVQRRIFRIFANVGFWAGLLIFVLGLFAIPKGWSFLGEILALGGLVCWGVWIVPEPETWLRLRFGRRKDALCPGIHLTIPFIDTKGKLMRPHERVLDLIPLPPGELPKIQIHDGVIYLRDYTLVLKMGVGFGDIVAAVYGVQDWPDWIRNKANSLIVGYIQTLTVAEATDEGMIRDNILDRIREAEGVAKEKLKRVRALKKTLLATMTAIDAVPDMSNPAIEDLDEEITRLIPLPKLYRGIAASLDNLITIDAHQRGILQITGAFCGAVKLSKEIEEARERVRVEKLKTEAALYKALQESAERIGPVLDMKEKLQGAGMGEESEALRTALAFELTDTLAKHGGAWAVALNQGGGEKGSLGAVPALLLKWLQSAATNEPADKKKPTPKSEEESA